MLRDFCRANLGIVIVSFLLHLWGFWIIMRYSMRCIILNPQWPRVPWTTHLAKHMLNQRPTPPTIHHKCKNTMQCEPESMAMHSVWVWVSGNVSLSQCQLRASANVNMNPNNVGLSQWQCEAPLASTSMLIPQTSDPNPNAKPTPPMQSFNPGMFERWTIGLPKCRK